MGHDCTFYTIQKCKYFNDKVMPDGELKQCGDNSFFSCTHEGGKRCGRFRELEKT
jgi:hypothetical protein